MKVGVHQMNLFEELYVKQENVNVRFVGFTSDDVRYDYGIIFTNMFFGKPLVVCMQTGRSSLLSAEDAKNPEHLKKVFQMKTIEQAEDLAFFFNKHLPTMSLEPQY